MCKLWQRGSFKWRTVVYLEEGKVKKIFFLKQYVYIPFLISKKRCKRKNKFYIVMCILKWLLTYVNDLVFSSIFQYNDYRTSNKLQINFKQSFNRTICLRTCSKNRYSKNFGKFPGKFKRSQFSKPIQMVSSHLQSSLLKSLQKLNHY